MTTLPPGRYATHDPADPAIVMALHVDPDKGWKLTAYTVSASGPAANSIAAKAIRRRPSGWLDQVCGAIEADPDAARSLYAKAIVRCQDCGRRLTDPVSKDRGVGPDCWAQRESPTAV